MTSYGDRVDNLLNVNGQKFIITIKCAEEHFVINFDEVDFELKCPYPPIEDNVTMPPWAVDHIQIVGDVFVDTLEIAHPENSIQPNFLMEVDHSEGVLRPNDTINVKINKTLGEKRGFNVTVNLFYEALQFHKKVGKTVMSLTFNEHEKGRLYFKSSYPNVSIANRTCFNKTLNLTLASKELDFEIFVMEEGFNVTLNGVYMCTYNGGLPTWAVHYITIESNNVELGSATNIICKPDGRCIRPSSQTDIYVQNGSFSRH
uniref:Galectin domain-containing protein n=1 Tax=Globodera pallida TaxID=36090 RepID=A0A183CNG6_GLOPA